MEAIKTSKVEEIEDLINKNLTKAFKRFRRQKIYSILEIKES